MAKKILLIDDEEDFCFFVKNNLERESAFDVITTTSGKEGIKLAKKIKPDLILLDILMPDISGDEVARQLRTIEGIKETPIVFLTATVRREEVEAKEGVIGGYPFIAKPVDVEKLIQEIERHISK
ncbi:MAG: response regulator [Candidatus Omnitrophica bacterium]|nr:response regulator [Candidatus Omnitrophota bacterium]